MSDVEITVGFGRETGIEASAVLAGIEVGFDLLFYKVEAIFIDNGFFLNFCHN